MYCKYQLLKYKPWDTCQNNVWNSTEPTDNSYIKAWHDFLCSPSAQLQVPNWEQKLQNVTQNVELETNNEHNNFEEEKIQEEWMILSDFHNSSANLSDTRWYTDRFDCNVIIYLDFFNLNNDLPFI